MTGDVEREESSFRRGFEARATRLRQRLGASVVLSGLSVGLVAGALGAFGLLLARQGPLRPAAAALGLVGAAAGLVAARRRALGDGQVAMFLDARLGGDEAITTAIELEGEGGEVARAVRERATRVLEQADARRLRVPVLRPVHGLAPVGAALIVWLSVMPLPRVPEAQAKPGVDLVALSEVRGLEKVAALESLRSPDPEQKKRLEKIANDAKALREKLQKGVDRKEALSEIARLSDAVQRERLALGDGERRQGLEAAIARLSQSPLTQGAAKALGDRDLVGFDDEMQRLANEREKADREQAKKALEEAAEAARKAGAEDVARELERQRDLLDKRGARADELRELARSLSGVLSEADRKQLEGMRDPKSDADAKKLSKALDEALKKLTPEERQKLAEALKKRLSQQQGELSPGTADRLRDMAKELETEEGKQRLLDELKRLAEEETGDPSAEGQQGLDDAQRGLGEAQGQLGGAPLPIPIDGPGGGKPSGKGSGEDKGDGAGGPNTDGSTGPSPDHKGQSRDVAGDGLKSRARARLDGRAPSAGITMGRAPGRPGDPANVRGQGALGEVGPQEVSGVDKNEVPDEYREQVGRYFQP